MTRDHADFYVGTGPNARWLARRRRRHGSKWLNSARRATPRRPPCSPPPTGTATRWPSPRCSSASAPHRRSGGFVAVPGPDAKVGQAVVGHHQQRLVRRRRRAGASCPPARPPREGPWFRPDPRCPPTAVSGPDAGSACRRVTRRRRPRLFTYTGFRACRSRSEPPCGRPTPFAHPRRGPPFSAGVCRAPRCLRCLGRGIGPLADLAAPASREVMHGLLQPGPGLHLLPAALRSR